MFAGLAMVRAWVGTRRRVPCGDPLRKGDTSEAESVGRGALFC
jgi:hypothetical protein